METSITVARESGKYHLISTNEEGQTISTDGAVDIGGDKKGMRPMELILAALGSCSAIDIISIMEKQRQPLDDIIIKIVATREKVENWTVYKKVHLHFIVKGEITSKKVERAIRLSLEEYCSVAQLLRKTANITYTFEISE